VMFDSGEAVLKPDGVAKMPHGLLSRAPPGAEAIWSIT